MFPLPFSLFPGGDSSNPQNPTGGSSQTQPLGQTGNLTLPSQGGGSPPTQPLGQTGKLTLPGGGSPTSTANAAANWYQQLTNPLGNFDLYDILIWIFLFLLILVAIAGLVTDRTPTQVIGDTANSVSNATTTAAVAA